MKSKKIVIYAIQRCLWYNIFSEINTFVILTIKLLITSGFFVFICFIKSKILHHNWNESIMNRVITEIDFALRIVAKWRNKYSDVTSNSQWGLTMVDIRSSK